VNEITREEWARRLLEDQLLRLDELRNANPRDAGFKLWRQTTLTVIQRIWPTDLARSERFRRIPFTTPSSKATRTHLKECYENGCVEAGDYLKGLIRELETEGLAEDARTAAGAEGAQPAAPKLDLSAVEPPAQESAIGLDFGPAPFGGEATLEEDEEAAPAPPALPFEAMDPGGQVAPRPKAAKPPPAARPSPPAAGLRAPSAPGSPFAPPPPPVQGPPPVPAAPQGTGPPAAPAPPAARSPLAVPRLDDRRALREMLGFADRQTAKPPPAEPPPAPHEPPAPREPRPATAQRPPDPSDPRSPTPPERPAPREDAAFEKRKDPPGSAKGPPREDGRDLAIQFLDASPVLGATPRPLGGPRPAASAEPSAPPAPSAPPRPEPAKSEPAAPAAGRAAKPRPPAGAEPPPPAIPSEASPAAAALTALAVEVAALGVPAKQRAETRAALLELARELDQQTATWETLREVISTVLEHPPLARRVVPLLVPYLDLE
jgi:hypothetical protein